MQPRNRIKEHRRVKARDLVSHELNPRTHGEAQKQALRELYEQIGFARSVLAYELPDGRLKLIDGHLRKSIDPDMEVEVEILDVGDEEARQLLLSLDPLAQLAGYEADTLQRLRELTPAPTEVLDLLWQRIGESQQAVNSTLAKAREEKPGAEVPPEQYLILVECADESEQLSLLERFQTDGLRCRALMS